MYSDAVWSGSIRISEVLLYKLLRFSLIKHVPRTLLTNLISAASLSAKVYTLEIYLHSRGQVPFAQYSVQIACPFPPTYQYAAVLWLHCLHYQHVAIALITISGLCKSQKSDCFACVQRNKRRLLCKRNKNFNLASTVITMTIITQCAMHIYESLFEHTCTYAYIV